MQVKHSKYHDKRVDAHKMMKAFARQELSHMMLLMNTIVMLVIDLSVIATNLGCLT